mmetsp:Transcript_19746/g.38097  ORF Transcript_19746/g.38097 Transcript_19746/m.38097 type:complete len:182 (+) Transcript_19746:694-1239(+)
MVEKLVILNTPLGKSSKLPDPLGSYTGLLKGFAFGKKVDAGMYHAGGGPYAFNYTDYRILQAPYKERDEARLSFEAMMENMDFNALVQRVSSAYTSFRKPALIAWGTDDRYLDLNTVIEWTQDKPTATKLFALPATIGHFPQFDFPQQIVETITRFVEGKDWTAPSDVQGKGPEGGGGPDL